MRVYDLARQVGVSNKELLEKVRSLGIEVKSHSSSIDDATVRQVLDAVEKESGRKMPDLASGVPEAPRGVIKKRAAVVRRPGGEEAETEPEAGKAAEVEEPKKQMDARSMALQALERAKAKRALQHQAMMAESTSDAGVEEATKDFVAPEHQRVEIGGTRTRREMPPVAETPVPPQKPVPEQPVSAQVQDVPSTPVAPVPPSASDQPETPATPRPPSTPQPQIRRQQRPTGRGGQVPQEQREQGRPAGRQTNIIRRKVELQQLPSLPKRKTLPPRHTTASLDLSEVPTIDVMKIKPVRRPAKRVPERDDAKARRIGKPKAAEVPAVGKKIRPGRFLNISALEANVGVSRGGPGSKAKPTRRAYQPSVPKIKEPKIYKIYGDLTVAEFADRIETPAGEIIMKAMGLGEMLNLNALISHEQCELLAETLGLKIEIVPESDELDLADILTVKEDMNAVKHEPRPPVVTVMGHVDHGKTSLLDAIRKTNVAEGEHGGITQHIGAYRVYTDRGEITFLDTPGHAAFTAMRARGATVTDIVVLIVAADDGIMPQTVEAINHARAAEAPLIVAINKIDVPGANTMKVRNDLMQYSLIDEALGGDTIICEVSAKTGEGIDHLLEMLLLQAEMMELAAPRDTLAEGVVIESNIDPLRGTNATVLVQSGTLKVGTPFVCGDVSGRVRLMLNEKGQEVQEALPAHPVEILGLNGCPQVGEKFLVVENERQARQIAQIRNQRRRRKEQIKNLRPHITIEGLADYLNESDKPKTLNVVLKGDVQGSVEAVADSMANLGTEKVSIRILHSGVGAISESDVHLAAASDAIIIGFNIRPDTLAADLARQEGIQIRTYRIIYDLLENLAAAMLGQLDTKFKEITRGKVEIRQIFRISRIGKIAGCHVQSGSIKRNDKVRLVRDGTVVYEGTLATLRRMKDDAKEVSSGFECGLTLNDFQDIKEGDIVEAYYEEEVEQTL